MKKKNPSRRITVYFYSRTHMPLGILPVLSGDIVIRRNEVSTWSIVVNGNSKFGQRFDRGDRVSIWDTTPGLEPVQLIAGAATYIEDELSGGVRTMTISGVDDMIWLDQGIMLPYPEKPTPTNGSNVSPTTGGYYNTGPHGNRPGGMILSLLDDQLAHAHEDHHQSRKNDMIVEYPPYLADMGDASLKEYSWGDLYKPLSEAVAGVFEASGWNGTIITSQTGGPDGRDAVFTTRSPRDYSRAVRLSMHNGAVDGFKIVEEAPELSQVYGIIPRLGEMWPMSRQLFTRSRNYSWWAFKTASAIDIEHGPDGDEHDIDDWYLDDYYKYEDEYKKRIADIDKELEGKGPKSSIEVSVQDTPYLSFPRRFGIGDIITVDLDDAQFTEQLQRVDMSWGTSGVRAKLQLGPELVEESNNVYPTIRDIKRKLRRTFIRS